MRGKLFKLVFYLLVLLALLIGAGLYSLDRYLQSNKTKLIQQLDTLHGGVASFGTIKVKVWQNFPNVSITIDSVTLHDSLHAVHQTPFLELSQIRADFSIRKILQDSLEIQRIHLSNGEVNIFTDKVGYNNLQSLFPMGDNLPNETNEKESFHIGTDKLELNLSNISIRFVDAPKYKDLAGTINNLVVNLDQRVADVDLDVHVKALAFNTRKGGYCRDCALKGQLKVLLEEEQIKIPLGPLRINNQDFMVGADIPSDKKVPTRLYFNNAATDFRESVNLLEPVLQGKVNPYYVDGPFPIEVVVEGTFEAGVDPIVTIDFSMNGNDVIVKGQSLENLQTRGRFVNRIYSDERSLTEGYQNLRLEFYNVAAQYGPFHINTPELLLLSVPGNTSIKSNAKILGKAPAISDWFETSQFLFDKGEFELDVQANSSVNNIHEFIVSCYANLVLQNIDVLYQPGDVVFPLDRLVLEKYTNEAQFEIVTRKFNPIHDLNLEGSLKNLPAILITLANYNASSDVVVHAKKISWTEFLDYFGSSPSTTKTESEKKQTLKRTINGLQNYFQPTFSVAIDTFTYYDKLLLTNFFSGLYFEDENTMVLEETTFHYDEGLIKISGEVDISNPYQTPITLNFQTEHLNLQKLLPSFNYFGIKMLANLDSLPQDLNLSFRHQGIINDSIGLMKGFNAGEISFNDGQAGNIYGIIQYKPAPEGLDTKISIDGNPELINAFFDSEDFFFKDGRFQVNLNYQGDLENVNQLIREASVNLSMKDSEIYYKPVDVYFPIKELLVETDHDDAQFDLTLQSDSLNRILNLKGKFENLHAFLVEDKNRTFHVQAEAYSPKFFFQDFQKLLKPGTNESAVEQDKSKTRESIKALLQTFDPRIKLKFDTFVYSDRLVLEKVYTGVQLLESDFLELAETGFTFHNGTVQLNGQFDLGGTNKAPFEVDMQTENLDVASFLRSLDYLGIKSLQETTQLEGRLSMQLEMEGVFDGDRQNLVADSTNGVITFHLQEVEIEGLQAIKAFAETIHQERRFADLRFAPITNTITVKGNHIHIPLTEVQSNAIHLFVEGDYHLDDDPGNLWISIPLNNLRKPDLNAIPDTTGYALAGKKVYLELQVDNSKETDVKFHTSKKKFYKQRGILDQYKIDRKRDKQIRKNAKRK